MIAGVVVKVIGALFSIPLTNMYGAKGNGIFNVAYNVYTAMFIISTAGLPVAVSKMVAESNSLGRGKEVHRIASVAMKAFFVIGIVFTALIVFGINIIVHFAGNSTRLAVLAVAPTIFFTCIISAIRGYYQGLSNMIPTAVSQIIEALGKLVFGLGIAYWLMKNGYSLEIVVAGAIGGVTVGTVLAAAYIIIFRARDARTQRWESIDDGQCRSDREILRTLINLAIPITVGASVLSVTNLIDAFVVIARLQSGCMMTQPEAQWLYGVYGIAVKLFNMPQSLIVGIGISIIPAISRVLTVKNFERARSLTESALRITGLVAFPCAIGLAVIPTPILTLLFPRIPDDVALASPLLIEISAAVFLVAMVTVTTNVLQAMGRVYDPMKSMGIGAVVKLVTNFILVGIPALHIHGAPIGTCLCYGSIMLLNLIAIRRQNIRFSITRSFLRPFISAVVMGAFVWLIFKPINAVLGNTLAVFLVVAMGAVVYVLMLIASKALPKEDILMLPKGEKIAKLLRIK